jgi:chemotaxis protein MotA
VIILGAAAGAYVIGNTGPVLKQTLGVFGTLLRGPRYNKAAYVELLGLQFTCSSWCSPRACWRSSRISRTRESSPIFQRFPTFAANHHAVEFMCDYLRMVTLGTNNVPMSWKR